MYLITGGAGFIGSHLAARLVERGERIRVFDNFSGGKRENLAGVSGEVEVIDGDLRDESAVRRATDGVEVVLHQGAEPSVPRSVADPRTSLDVNVTGTLNVLLAARDAGCRRVVFASSCAVYGDDPVMPKTERMLPTPLSPYAASKLTGEQLCAVFDKVYGFEAVALRYFNVFGPRQDPSSAYAAVIPRFLASLLARSAPTIYGDGGQSRDFVYVDDVVEANLLAATVPGVSGKVYNVAGGRSVTLNEMLALLQRLTRRSVEAIYEPERAGDIRHSLADISAARAELGYEVRVPFEEGLARTVAAAEGSLAVAEGGRA